MCSTTLHDLGCLTEAAALGPVIPFMDEEVQSADCLRQLLEQRLSLVSNLAESLQASTEAIGRNEAEMISRGAEHQAELCRQWSALEEKLRHAARPSRPVLAPTNPDSGAAAPSERLRDDWEHLEGRVRCLVRMHASLLRHAERSMAIVARIVDAYAPTYSPTFAPTYAPPPITKSLAHVRMGE